MCFPAQIEIFTDSENSNRTNNPRKDSNIFVVLSFTSNGKMKLFTVALILCLQAGSLLGGKRKHLNILLTHSSKSFSILLCKIKMIKTSSNILVNLFFDSCCARISQLFRKKSKHSQLFLRKPSTCRV